MKKKIVIVGATSSMATHCARLWAANKDEVEFTLLGRDTVKLERLAADLRARNAKVSVQTMCVDFEDPVAIQATVLSIAANGAVDIVLIAHGSLGDQAHCQEDLVLNKSELIVNAVSPVLYAEAFAQAMEKTGEGTLAIVGSVAGDRGRKSNYVYGSAKGLVTRYAQGLQHRFANTAIKVVLIKPGPTDTPMTAHLKAQGMRLDPVDTVAKGIVQAIEAGKAVAYTPGKWWVIMMIIRHLPNFIFNKMNI